MKIKTILEFSKLKVQDKTSWVSLLRKIVIILYFNQLIEYIPGTSFEKGSYIKEQCLNKAMIAKYSASYLGFISMILSSNGPIDKPKDTAMDMCEYISRHL